MFGLRAAGDQRGKGQAIKFSRRRPENRKTDPV